jgi:hypothetical protein
MSIGMVTAISDGSPASSPSSRSAGGQDEQPCEVNSSITARASAKADGTLVMDEAAITA